MKTNNMMYKRHIFTPIIKTLAALLLLVGGAAQAQTTDTVRIGDPRFMFSQITDTSYFFKYFENSILSYTYAHFVKIEDSTNNTLHAIHSTIEHKTDGKEVLLYGLAMSLDFYSTYTPWDLEDDTIWLKVRRGKEVGYVGEVMDSLRITPELEEKTLLFEGHPYDENNVYHILFDSLIYDAVPLYCAYFEHPLYIEDSNFFVSLELVAHPKSNSLWDYPGIMLRLGFLSTKVTVYVYYYDASSSPCGVTGWCPRSDLPYHLNRGAQWPAILPIIAPQGTPPPGWTPDPNPDPDPTESIDKADNSDLKIYPNPARRQFSVQSGVQVLRVEMYDVMGRKVREWGSSSQSYDLDGIPSGLYMVKVMNAKGSTTKKMTIR